MDVRCLSPPPLCLLRQGLSAEPRACQLASLASQRTLVTCLCLSSVGITGGPPCLPGFYVGSVNLDSGLQIKHFLSELSPLCLFEAESHVAQARLRLLLSLPSLPSAGNDYRLVPHHTSFWLCFFLRKEGKTSVFWVQELLSNERMHRFFSIH